MQKNSHQENISVACFHINEICSHKKSTASSISKNQINSYKAINCTTNSNRGSLKGKEL
jgi:hypothetical protein